MPKLKLREVYVLTFPQVRVYHPRWRQMSFWKEKTMIPHLRHADFLMSHSVCLPPIWTLSMANLIELGLYRRKTYGNGIGQDGILLDAESEPGYTGAIPGTVTAKGFGVECWEAEYLSNRKIEEPRKAEKTKFKCIEEKKILRRIDEMRRGTRLHERSEDQRKADLEEFTVAT